MQEACISVRIRRFKDMEKREMKCGVYYDCLLYTSLAIEIKEISLIVFLTNICNYNRDIDIIDLNCIKQLTLLGTLKLPLILISHVLPT